MLSWALSAQKHKAGEIAERIDKRDDLSCQTSPERPMV